MIRFIATLAIALVSCFSMLSLKAAEPVRTYLAKVETPNDCPANEARISIPFMQSPLYDPVVVYIAPPPPVRACADVAKVSPSALKAGSILVTYENGKFIGVQSVRAF